MLSVTEIEMKQRNEWKLLWDNLRKHITQIDRSKEIFTKLTEMGVENDLYFTSLHMPFIEVKAEDLPKIRKACGEPFKLYLKQAQSHNIVRIYLHCAGITWYYDRKYTGEGKCKIIPSAHVQYAIVCEK